AEEADGRSRSWRQGGHRTLRRPMPPERAEEGRDDLEARIAEWEVAPEGRAKPAGRPCGLELQSDDARVPRSQWGGDDAGGAVGLEDKPHVAVASDVYGFPVIRRHAAGERGRAPVDVSPDCS